MSHDDSNHWRGFALGALGGIAGVLAMSAYWTAVKQITGVDPREKGHDTEDDPPHRLDDISLIGRHHRANESSTAAMGRLAYQAVTGITPDKKTKNALSWAVHWVISLSAAGLYGALRQPEDAPDVIGGLALGGGLWLLGDEGLMPLLGLTDGPTAYSFDLHAHGLGAHMAYGLATAAAAQILDELI